MRPSESRYCVHLFVLRPCFLFLREANSCSSLQRSVRKVHGLPRLPRRWLWQVVHGRGGRPSRDPSDTVCVPRNHTATGSGARGLGCFLPSSSPGLSPACLNHVSVTFPPG